MISKGKNILIDFKKRWQLMLALEVLLYGFGAAVLVYFVGQNLIASLISFLIISLIAAALIKPWKPNLSSASSYVDSKLESAEYSSGLLLSPSENLSSLAKLQQIKVSKQLGEHIKDIKPPNNLSKSIVTASLLVLIGFLFNQFNLQQYFQSPIQPATPENVIIFKTKDSADITVKPPKVLEQFVTIRYPEYTNIKSFTTTNMNIKALEGSKVFWKLTFDSEIKKALMESGEADYPMTENEGSYRRIKTLSNSGFYNFKFEDLTDKIHSSDLYAIDVFKDESPSVEIKGIKQFTSFNYDDEKIIQFNSEISDDFGISDAYIIATVSKGTGESVKFREEKLSFENSVVKGAKRLTLSKKINLNNMKMEPGDELYFYVETSDFKQPRKNTSRSETYFAAIKDTTSYEFGVEGTLGVNRMPDYFRSQRQLIIDTEKLISERKNLTHEEFKFKSNELGFDQKALRLKYGEFMGVESESGLDVEQEESHTEEEEHDSDDPLAEYTHDHDGDNEHNLVADKTEEKDKVNKNPLQEFMHDHGDPEMATLFEESLKVKMHKAMSEMWDAELYLRLYEPNKSLPYQYKALQLIQDIKNHARIYVHRIGFDPPPIKEEKRLTGKHLDKITSFRKKQDLHEADDSEFIKKAISKLETLIGNKENPSSGDTIIFEKAASELSTKAIESPGKHLRTLQKLKDIIESLDYSEQTLLEVQNGLLMAVPIPEANPTKTDFYLNEVDQLLLKELDTND